MPLLTPLLKQPQRFWAHTREDSHELLEEHTQLTRDYQSQMDARKGVFLIFKRLANRIASEHGEWFESLLRDAIIFHDLGKVNAAFQELRMQNPEFQNTSHSPNHALLSAQLFMACYSHLIPSGSSSKEKQYLAYLFKAACYVISKHHGGLDAYDDLFEKKLYNDINHYQDDFEIPFKSELKQGYMLKIAKFFNDTAYPRFILIRYLHSIMVSADYYATAEFMLKQPLCDTFGTLDQELKGAMRRTFESSPIIRSIRDRKANSTLNKLRATLFLEAENRLKQSPDAPIYYLEAPTGSGKTLTSLNLALSLLESDERLNRVIYVFPFNTLIEQTQHTVNQCFDGVLKARVLNSQTPYNGGDQQHDEAINYESVYADRLLMHAPFILTTHVRLFSMLFGSGREHLYPLWQLANSVVVLDEIQAYNPELWAYMGRFFHEYATLLNIRFIIMSATLPPIHELLDDSATFMPLLKDAHHDYFLKPEFAKRVEIDMHLMETIYCHEHPEMILSIIEREAAKKVLVEFVLKKSARTFYNAALEALSDRYEVYELSGDDNPAIRQRVINASQNPNPVLIVATQVIEAGVDIDMDLGFKDCSIFESEEQFMGRINRNAMRSGKVYFFNSEDAKIVYQGDVRYEFGIYNPEQRKRLDTKDFKSYYRTLIQKLNTIQSKTSQRVPISNAEAFNDLVSRCEFKRVEEEMKLIDSRTLRLFLNVDFDHHTFPHPLFEEAFVREFMNDDETKISARKVWTAFCKSDEIQSYTKRQYQLSQLNALMNFFIFTLYPTSSNPKPPIYDHEHRGVYFLERAEHYMQEGKFNREAYNCDAKSEYW